MGYRISLYRCPKEYIDKVRDYTNEDFYEKGLDGEMEEIKYDTLAHVLDTGKEVENNLCSRVFNNRLNIEDDQSFYTISKEQLLNIIEYIRKNNIYEYGMTHTVDYDDENKEICKDLKIELWRDPSWENAIRYTSLQARHDVESWNHYWVDDDGTKHYINIDLTDNKWWISNGMTYRYAIFNFIHILKCFDWENDYLVALGG